MKPTVVAERCSGCPFCLQACLDEAIEITDNIARILDNCTECELCIPACPTGAIQRVGGSDDVLTPETCSGVAVLVLPGTRVESARATLAAGRPLAETLGCYLTAAVVGSEGEDGAKTYRDAGADEVTFLGPCDGEAAVREGVGAWIRQARPEVVLVGADACSKALAARLAQRFDTVFLGGAVSLEMDVSDRALLAGIPRLGGAMIEEMRSPMGRPQFASVV